MPSRGAIARTADARSAGFTWGGLTSRTNSVSATAKTPSLSAVSRLGSPGKTGDSCTPRSTAALPVLLITPSSKNGSLFPLLHRRLVLRHQLRLGVRRHGRVVREIYGIRSLPARHRLQSRLVIGKFR